MKSNLVEAVLFLAMGVASGVAVFVITSSLMWAVVAATGTAAFAVWGVLVHRLIRGGGTVNEAFDWVTVGSTDRAPTDKLGTYRRHG